MNKVSFVGAGSMAEAIIAGIRKEGFLSKENIYVTNKTNQERLDHLVDCYNITCEQDKEVVLKDADMIVLTMKPYDMEVAIDEMKPYVNKDQLIVSVAAGISTDFIEKQFGMEIPVVRVMPNTSASVGSSASAIAKGEYATEKHVHQTDELFQTVGTTTIVDEDLMHTVTGISGSGPAYIYYLVEAMEEAAVKSGLDKEIAKSLVTQTIIGAGEMLKQSGETADVLRKKITSPAGTTHAGIETLKKRDFQEAIMECVYSARERSIELGKQ
ncbi:pyrroline-5-carboxylate reductase [Oceanobacillus halotolerans]|uniref:pyrroline-5-carboxylate reductase n=1 Tax=Oceanobacillus halotolerans TaxID=2663380 RepID=UPI0013D19004|nr:pyrroline-5-carboxylate reductase [Oceanobacillus halotolerans]